MFKREREEKTKKKSFVVVVVVHFIKLNRINLFILNYIFFLNRI